MTLAVKVKDDNDHMIHNYLQQNVLEIPTDKLQVMSIQQMKTILLMMQPSDPRMLTQKLNASY